MDPGPCQKIINVNGDRLSVLPDDLIHIILSSLDVKHVIETSVLSSRWRYIWTSMPFLNFSSNGFPSLLKFSKFVTNVLSRRNDEIDLSFVNLSFRGKSSQHLTLSGGNIDYPIIVTSSTWELPAVTTLDFSFIIFEDVITDKYVGLFSKFTNLKSLTLNRCKILGSDDFTICHPQLSNLKFMNEHRALRTVNVVAPKLKNLSLALSRYDSLQFISDSFPFLEKVDLRIGTLYMTKHHKIIDLFQQFYCVKFLSLNLEIVEALTSIMEQIVNQPSPFPNLKSLKICPLDRKSALSTQLEENVSKIVKNYLLDNSAGPTLIMDSYEVMRAKINAELAQKRMEELRVLLNQEKENTDMAENQGEQRAELPLHIQGRMVKIQRCWDNLNRMFRHEKMKVRRISNDLQEIEMLLKEVPASKRDMLHACFSSLCAEADIAMNKYIDRMKIHCHKKMSRLIVQNSNH